MALKCFIKLCCLEQRLVVYTLTSPVACCLFLHLHTTVGKNIVRARTVTYVYISYGQMIAVITACSTYHLCKILEQRPSRYGTRWAGEALITDTEVVLFAATPTVLVSVPVALLRLGAKANNGLQLYVVDVSRHLLVRFIWKEDDSKRSASCI